jgi:hypothetical protein
MENKPTRTALKDRDVTAGIGMGKLASWDLVRMLVWFDDVAERLSRATQKILTISQMRDGRCRRLQEKGFFNELRSKSGCSTDILNFFADAIVNILWAGRDPIYNINPSPRTSDFAIGAFFSRDQGAAQDEQSYQGNSSSDRGHPIQTFGGFDLTFKKIAPLGPPLFFIGD